MTHDKRFTQPRAGSRSKQSQPARRSHRGTSGPGPARGPWVTGDKGRVCRSKAIKPMTYPVGISGDGLHLHPQTEESFCASTTFVPLTRRPFSGLLISSNNCCPSPWHRVSHSEREKMRSRLNGPRNASSEIPSQGLDAGSLVSVEPVATQPIDISSLILHEGE